MIACAPLEKKLACLNIDLLEQAVVDPAVFKPADCAQIRLADFVDGQDRGALVGNFELMQVALMAVGG